MYIVTEVADIEAGPSGYIAGRSTKAGQRLHLAVNGCCSHRLYREPAVDTSNQ